MKRASGTGGKKTLRVAAIQLTAEVGKITENIKYATPYVEKAATQGARLILLPELLMAGYMFTSDWWNGGEPSNGPTVKWMKETSKRLGIWLGTSILEAEGENFYNTFVLTNPEGGEDGRVRKRTPAFAEAYFFKGETNSQVIHSELGRVGVGICFDNVNAYTARNMYSNSVDIMLQPHASPILKSWLFSEKSSAKLNVTYEQRATHYADILGVPVIYCNRTGPLKSPMPGLPFLNQDTYFAGLSAIVDSKGTVKARMGRDDGMIIKEIVLDPACKKKVPPITYGKWAMPNMHWTRKTKLLEYMGRIGYAFSRERKRRARAISCCP